MSGWGQDIFNLFPKGFQSIPPSIWVGSPLTELIHVANPKNDDVSLFLLSRPFIYSFALSESSFIPHWSRSLLSQDKKKMAAFLLFQASSFFGADGVAVPVGVLKEASAPLESFSLGRYNKAILTGESMWARALEAALFFSRATLRGCTPKDSSHPPASSK